jgi:hypothetical protein
MTTLPSDRSSPWSKGEIAEFLDQLKARQPAPAASAGRGRLIFALDATASREPTWDQACRIQGEMFEATAAIGGLDLQLVFYRGFDECKSSRWLGTAADLHRVMRSVSCAGGETQIERLLSHALAETSKRKVNALVFVGDAMEEKADRLCRLAGELGALGVPIFLFHEGFDPDAEAAFRQIASLSHGAYLPFDLASIDRLRQLLAAVAVFATGGHTALALWRKDRRRGAAPDRAAAELNSCNAVMQRPRGTGEWVPGPERAASLRQERTKHCDYNR